MTITYIALAASIIAAAVAIAHAARHGYLRAPDKYGHPLRPRDPADTAAWEEHVRTRRLRQAVIPWILCVALGLAIGVLFLY